MGHGIAEYDYEEFSQWNRSKISNRSFEDPEVYEKKAQETMKNITEIVKQTELEDNTKASKNDKLDNKPDYSLLPKVFMDQVSYVMMAGAKKYGRYNYTKGHNITQLIAAAERHLKALQEGEDIDKDCSDRVGVEVSHAACVASNMLMILHQTELSSILDDRFKSNRSK